MIDYAFKFADEASAITAALSLNPQLSRNLYMQTGDNPVAGSWNLDHVIPNVKVWRPSQDTTQTMTDSKGAQLQIVIHTYLSGWFAIVAANTETPIQVLFNASQLQFALNRTAREAGQPFVLKNNIGGIITDICCAPTFLMQNSYPVGNYA